MATAPCCSPKGLTFAFNNVQTIIFLIRTLLRNGQIRDALDLAAETSGSTFRTKERPRLATAPSPRASKRDVARSSRRLASWLWDGGEAQDDKAGEKAKVVQAELRPIVGILHAALSMVCDVGLLQVSHFSLKATALSPPLRSSQPLPCPPGSCGACTA